MKAKAISRLQSLYYVGRFPDNANMRIPDEYLHGVCFLSIRMTPAPGDEEIDYYIGTAFVVVGPTRWPTMRIFYLVTAKHIIERAKKAGYDEIRVRWNRKDGTSITVPVFGEWHYSKNPAVDVAVMPTPIFNVIGEELRVSGQEIGNFATEDVIRKENIGIGDDIFAVGLFNQKWGEERNAPIMRTGIIAAMPDEPLEAFDDEGEVIGNRKAYLIEIRSIGGLSGSPVYVSLDLWRNHPEEELRIDLTKGDFKLRRHRYLLGMISSHWDLKRQDSAQDDVIPDKLIAAATDDEEIDRLNTGIAIVTPIQEVLDIINSDALMAVRKKAEAFHRTHVQPTYDALKKSKKRPNSKPKK